GCASGIDRASRCAGGFARDEGVRGDPVRAETLPSRRYGWHQICDRVGRVRRGALLLSRDPLLRVGPVVVGLLGATVMDTGRFRLTTSTQSDKRRLQHVSMERPQVAD